MPFTPKAWQDSPNTTTPLSAAALTDLETRLSGYADTIGGYVAPQAPPASASRKMLTTFQSGWTKTTGNGTLTLLDTSHPGYLQSGALRIDLPDNVQTKVRNTSAPAWNLTGQQLLALIWVSDPTLVTDCKIFLGSDALNTYTNYGYFDLLGSGATFRPVQAGEWVWVPFDFADLNVTGSPTRTINNIQIQVTSPTGTAATVLFGGLAMTAEPAQGYATICFDDCWRSQYTLAKGLIDQYGWPATAAVIRDLIDNGNATYMTPAMMHELSDVHHWEFISHASTVANHNAGFNTLSNAALITEITQIKQWLAANGFGSTADLFAIPLGAYTLAQLQIYKQYFRATRTLDNLSQRAMGSFPPSNWGRLWSGGLNSTNASTVPAAITQTVNNKGWIILLFHDIVASGASTSLQMNQSDFTTILSALNSSGLQVRSLNDMARLAAP